MKRNGRKQRRKDPNVYPSGWNYKRVMAVAKYYDDRKEVDLIGDVELPDPKSLPVWVEVPQALLPKVRRLLASHRSGPRRKAS